MAGVVEHRQSHGHALLGAGRRVLQCRDELLALIEDRVEGEETGGVAVISDAEEGEVEPGHAVLEQELGRAEEGLVLFGGLLGRYAHVDRVNLALRDADKLEEEVVRDPVVAVDVVGGDAALRGEPDVPLGEVHLRLPLFRREAGDQHREVAARQHGDVEHAALLDGLGGALAHELGQVVGEVRRRVGDVGDGERLGRPDLEVVGVHRVHLLDAVHLGGKLGARGAGPAARPLIGSDDPGVVDCVAVDDGGRVPVNEPEQIAGLWQHRLGRNGLERVVPHDDVGDQVLLLEAGGDEDDGLGVVEHGEGHGDADLGSHGAVLDGGGDVPRLVQDWVHREEAGSVAVVTDSKKCQVKLGKAVHERELFLESLFVLPCSQFRSERDIHWEDLAHRNLHEFEQKILLPSEVVVRIGFRNETFRSEEDSPLLKLHLVLPFVRNEPLGHKRKVGAGSKSHVKNSLFRNRFRSKVGDLFANIVGNLLPRSGKIRDGEASNGILLNSIRIKVAVFLLRKNAEIGSSFRRALRKSSPSLGAEKRCCQERNGTRLLSCRNSRARRDRRRT
mmetsp:Transcript_10582/g.18554  ORF Transcript_10582/g.18554 Transcript_10582/m.18554 type:complete len:560 (-) Transcript_10582:116-1795(-)